MDQERISPLTPHGASGTSGFYRLAEFPVTQPTVPKQNVRII